MHIRNTLRTTLRSRLEATPTAAAKSPPSSIVFDSLAQVQKSNTIPSFAYWINSENVSSMAKRSSFEHDYRRETRVEIIIIDKTVSGLETLAEEVEEAMTPPIDLGAGLQMTLLTETSFDESIEGEYHYFVARLSYQVTYATTSNNPTQTQPAS